MEILSATTSINADNDGTRRVLIHADLSARKESSYMFPLLSWVMTAVLLPRRRGERYSSSVACGRLEEADTYICS